MYLCYTDGSCKAGDRAPCGWGYFIKTPQGAPLEGHGHALDTLAKVMEYRAVAEALAVLPEGAEATVFSDNQSLIENFEKRVGHWRLNGFAKVDAAIVASVRAADATITSRRLRLSWKWVRGHNGNEGNERADALAAQGAREAKASLKGLADLGGSSSDLRAPARTTSSGRARKTGSRFR